MPLVATYNGSPVEAHKMSAHLWQALKLGYNKGTLVMGCGADAVPKVSSNGFQFFAHKPSTSCSGHEGGRETAEHLLAKALVAESATAAGWKATIEFAGPNRKWVADVLVKKASLEIALEIQCASQSDVEFKRRQERYEGAGLKCFWFVTANNAKAAFAARVPFIEISVGAKAATATIRDAFSGFKSVDIADAVRSVLELKYRRKVEICATSMPVTYKLLACGSCGEPSSVVSVDSVRVTSRCGGSTTFRSYPMLRQVTEYAAVPSVFDAIGEAFALASIPRPAPFRIATDELSWAGNPVSAHLCPHCGQHWESWIRFENLYNLDTELEYVDADGLLTIPRKAIFHRHRCDGSCRQRFQQLSGIEVSGYGLLNYASEKVKTSRRR